MNKITIIMPVHKFEEDYIKNAIMSVDKLIYDEGQVRFMVVGPMEICGKVKECLSNKLNSITDFVFNENCDFVTQINNAVKQCKTPYFSILEYDDVYMQHAIKTIEGYMEEKTDVSIFLSLNELYDENGKFICFANELPWDVAFVGAGNEIGYIGDEELEGMNDYNCTGGVFKTEDFVALGGLKKSMKAIMWYEFLKRYAINGKKVFVVPIVCYGHTINRDGSYMTTEGKNISKDELEFLFANVKDECKSIEDTNKIYKPQE